MLKYLRVIIIENTKCKKINEENLTLFINFSTIRNFV